MSRSAALAALTCLWAPACVDTSPDPEKGGAGAADDGGADTAAGPTVDRGPTTLEIDGDPNGLWWDGALYTSWYLSDAGNRAGAVSLLDLSGGEETLVSGFVKPVGVIVLDGALIVSDQLDNLIVRCPLDDPEDKQIFARVDGPDLLSAGPDGGVFTGGPGGELRLAFPDDAFEVIQGGFQEVRGVAYDPDNRRVFVVDHDGDDSDGTVNFLHILPVDR